MNCVKCWCETLVRSYPINRLRNAGIRCVESSHYFVVDVPG